MTWQKLSAAAFRLLSCRSQAFGGVRGKQRWVAAVPLINEMVAEVRKRIPADAIAELSDQRLSQEQAAKLNLRLGDVRCID